MKSLQQFLVSLGGRIRGSQDPSTEPRWHRQLFREIDIAWLAALRIAFGAIMFWEVWRFFERGFIERYWIDPDFNFKYLGFEWVHTWPGNGMYIHFLIMGLAAIGITLGCFYRISATLFFLGYTYAFLSEQAIYQNHYYLICLVSFLMIFVPAHRALSLDVWMGRTRELQKIHAWPRLLIGAQVFVVYFYGGIAKINGDWLQGEPMRMWLDGRDDYALIGGLLDSEFAAYFYSYTGLLFDLAIPFLLMIPRTRLWAFAAVALFHFNNAIIFSIGVFPVFATALSTVFFKPDWPRRFIERGWFTVEDAKPQTSGSTQPWLRPSRRLILGFVSGWIVVQCLVPLRHHFYPGPVHWTDEGHRFSWRMKLRDKEQRGMFKVKDLESGEQWHVRPSEFLTPFQTKRIEGRPDMVLQASKQLAELMEEEHQTPVAVHALLQVSLNGRPYQTWVDPKVNLAAEPKRLGPAGWLRPLTAPLKGDPRPTYQFGGE